MQRRNLTTIRNFISSVLAVGIFCLTPMVSQAQSVNKRLENIEKQLKAVQRKVFKPGSAFPQTQQTQQSPTSSNSSGVAGNVRAADIEARIAEVETQLRQLTGRIEEGNFQANKLKQRMDIMARDYEFRFKELEKAGTAVVTPVTSPEAVAAKTPAANNKKILPDGSAKDQYGYAQKLVTKGQYAEAETALVEFLKRYPKAPLAGNAQYWLGQTYYVRKMYTKATRVFLEGYNNFPKSPKAPAFLLKIGMSLNAMGEKADACDAYLELASRYPDSLESKNKRPAQEKKAGCS